MFVCREVAPHDGEWYWRNKVCSVSASYFHWRYFKIWLNTLLYFVLYSLLMHI